MKYKSKLLDIRWQKKRLEIFKRDKFQCRSCYAHEGTMHVHHLKYLMRYEPWEYDDDDLITLCDDCHAEWHRLFDNNSQPGKTFLVAKLHFDLDIKAMQDDKAN